MWRLLRTIVRQRCNESTESVVSFSRGVDVDSSSNVSPTRTISTCNKSPRCPSAKLLRIPIENLARILLKDRWNYSKKRAQRKCCTKIVKSKTLINRTMDHIRGLVKEILTKEINTWKLPKDSPVYFKLEDPTLVRLNEKIQVTKSIAEISFWKNNASRMKTYRVFLWQEILLYVQKVLSVFANSLNEKVLEDKIQLRDNLTIRKIQRIRRFFRNLLQTLPQRIFVCFLFRRIYDTHNVCIGPSCDQLLRHLFRE